MEINLNSKNYLQSNSESFEPMRQKTQPQYKDQLLSQHQRVETNKSYSICSLIQDLFCGIWNLIRGLFCFRYQTKESSQSQSTSETGESLNSSTSNTEEKHKPETKQQLLPNPPLEQSTTETQKESKLETEQESLDFSKLLLSMRPSTSLDATKIQPKNEKEAFEQFLNKLSECISVVAAHDHISFENNPQTHLSIVLYFLCKYEGNQYAHPFNLFEFSPTHELISYLIETRNPELSVEFFVQSIFQKIIKTTPLHVIKSIRTAELLLEKNKDLLKTKNSEGQIPLHKAGNVAMATFLIEQGSDVNAQDNDKNRPLHEASSLELVELLLTHHAEVNAYNSYGETPLIKMVSDQKEALALRLLQAGAKTDVYNRNKEPLFHLAIGNKLSGIVTFLIEKKVWLNEENPEGRTPLALALSNASYGLHGQNLTYAKQLIEAGTKLDVPMKKDSQDFLIHFVITHEWDELFFLMIQKGADIEKKDSNKSTALACAVHQYYYTTNEKVKKMVEALINQGAELDVYMGSNSKDYLIHYVIGKKYYDIFSLMMEKGVSIEDKDGDGRTALVCALHYASYEKNNKDLKKMIHDLITKGADLNVKISSTWEQFILHTIVENQWTDILTSMIQKGGLNLEVTDAKGQTPFTLALYNTSFGSHKESFSIAKLLIEAGTNIEGKMSKDSNTPPIHFIVEKRLEEILDALIAKKGNLETLDWEGRTPLGHALKNATHSYQSEQSIKIAEKLIQAGANVNAKMDSKSQQTLFQFASFEKSLESICKLMKEKGATE